MRLIAIGIVSMLAATASADVITQWNFNGPAANQVPGGNLSPTPSTGAGLASLVGGVTADPNFGSGTANGGSSDPVAGTPPDYAWQTTTYAPQGQQNGERGVQFNVSTVGFTNILVHWDQRHSNTSSRWVQFLYALDGTTFTNAGLANDGVFEGPAGDTWFNNRTVDLSGVAGAANNANFAWRVVAIFAPGSGGYVASTGTATYATTGTWRFDMATVEGAVIPAPGALALLGAAVLVSRRRR